MVAKFSVSKVVLRAPKVMEIEVDQIQIDGKYQRLIKHEHVEKMYEEYRGLSVEQAMEKLPENTGFLCVGVRGDRSKWAVDGQQRIALAKMLKAKYGIKELFMHCEVFNSQGRKHESEVYTKRNHRKDMTPCEKFKGKFMAGDKNAVAINKILFSFGIGISGIDYPNKVRKVSCIGACEKAYNAGGSDHLHEVLDILGNAWASQKQTAKPAFKGIMIVGLSIFLQENNDCDREKLVKWLAKTTPENIIGAAAAKNPEGLSSGYGRNEKVAEQIAEIYKRRLAMSNRTAK